MAKAYATSWVLGGTTRAGEVLTIPTVGVLNPQEGTVECWVKPGAVINAGTQTSVLFDTREGAVTPDNALICQISTTKAVQLLVGTGSSYYTLTSTTTLTADQWSHIAFRWSPSGTALFINGTLEASSATAPSNVTLGSDFYIGNDRNGGYQSNGLIDDLRISSRARTDAEIAAAYSSNAPLPVDSSTTCKMSFDGTLKPTVKEDYGLIVHGGKIEADVIVAGQYANKLGKTPVTVVVADGSTTQDVKRADYVVPAGATNAQVTINNAINSLPAGGGKVLLLEGTYIIDGSIVIPSNVALEGQGNSTVIRIKDALNTDINVIQNADQINGNTKIALRNFSIDGNKANNTSGVQYGVYLYKVTLALISGLSVSYCRTIEILVKASQNNTITGNTCYGNYYGDGIRLDSSSNNTVAGNTCQGNYCGICLYSSSNNTVTGNVCQGSKDSGIYLDISSSNTITGNTCQGNYYGIHLDSSSNNTVAGNVCQGNYFHGIHLDSSSNNTVTENTCLENSQITNNSYDNIRVIAGSNYNNIQSNVCRMGGLDNKPQYGIRIYSSDCNGNIVTNNDLYQSGVSGSLSDSGTGTITAAGNRL